MKRQEKEIRFGGMATMDKERISYHESVQTMYERIKKDRMTNVWVTIQPR